MVNRVRIRELTKEKEKHENMLASLPEGITDTYKKYYVSYHLNEVERLETELEEEYNK